WHTRSWGRGTGGRSWSAPPSSLVLRRLLVSGPILSWDGDHRENPTVTLRQLEVFLAVAGERSFSRAAKKIHSSQPTLSEHVSELERELGKKLFSRRGREVTLTEAGRVFDEYAARAISAVDGARQASTELDGLGHGSVLVRSMTTPGLYMMPEIIAAFPTRYHRVELNLQCANSHLIEL